MVGFSGFQPNDGIYFPSDIELYADSLPAP